MAGFSSLLVYYLQFQAFIIWYIFVVLFVVGQVIHLNSYLHLIKIENHWLII